MTTTTTYLDDLGRVRVAFTGLDTDADYAVVERSTDGITWATVRGGDKVGVSGGAGKLDDYEFTAGVANTYRVTAVDAASITQFGVGVVATGNNATLNPALPAGSIPTNALLLLFVTHTNTGATITTPTGWTLLAGGAGHMAVFYRKYAPGVTAPSVAFAGGVAGDSCSAYIRAFLNADTPVHAALQTNTSAQDVAYPGATLAQDGTVWLLHLWKKAVFTGVTALPTTFIDAQGISNTAGANAESHLSWRTDATANVRTVLSGSSAWTGGTAAVSKARLLRMTRRVNVGIETSTITPVLDTVWLKNVRRPSLNRKVTVSGLSDITRPARVAIMDVVGRTMPVAINDVRGSQRLTITVTTPSLAAAADFDNALLTGHVVFLQAPELDCAVPTLYASIGDTAKRKTAARGVRRYFDLPLTEVAAPASTVYSDTFTIADVVATYATIADVVAAVPTISALMDKVSTAVVIVP